MDFFKFKKIDFSLKNVMVLPLERAWVVFLLVMAFLLLLVLLLDGWVFLRISSFDLNESAVSGNNAALEIRPEILNGALIRMREKEENFKRFRQGAFLDVAP